ncbi:MAG: transcription/translation regulatory transformer protein RfaH [Candidatus Accumulibacter sp.]|nr:transcription/translation regulatory transformer protein RfaH [Accumulibacter sp.]
MKWYLVHTKPRQERAALRNLDRQGYVCYLPFILQEKLHRNKRVVVDEPLFPRYLFIRLGSGENAKSWSPVRSTPGVSCLVVFGGRPAPIDDRLIEALRERASGARHTPIPLFCPGERLKFTGGAFSGLDAVYRMTDGEGRAMVLVELLSKPAQMTVSPADLRKAS